MELNPDWIIQFWYSKEVSYIFSWQSLEHKYNISCDDYFPELMKLPIKKTEIDYEMFGFKKEVSESHKGDYMRVSVLNLYGGVWSDMDVIYFKPMTSLKVNTSENKEIETFVCIGPYGHSTGFVMSSENNKFFKKLSYATIDEYRPIDYQCLGPDMFNKYGRTIKDIEGYSSAINLDMDVVYAHNCWQIKELMDGSSPKFTDGSIGCHWYGGHPMWEKFINETNGGLTNLPESIISDLLRCKTVS
jgi:mannosyltransferase OCH1-like enzyme